MPNVLNKIKTQQNVEALRSAMIKSGTENGLNHPTTIKLSQNLDKLLNEYTLTFSN
ncbi:MULTISPECIES: aspartyl-phosphate phosphatase Spo0E family protein [Solibacillus]|uniref:aspartyl-phosphate phosphatase Spo0E family protein n=1 Tax=Solibacillus TaxID=648800 RepID=UPI00203F862D|nr:aspartyl-phosphate phosphatase Spo0E family protein [Solibacillus isronensis]MCM3721056.1 aspartyl-phosphate phosphatase Spo0E family protein [Solibacillus isronensis]